MKMGPVTERHCIVLQVSPNRADPYADLALDGVGNLYATSAFGDDVIRLSGCELRLSFIGRLA